MKTVRMISIAMAVVMLVSAMVPFAVTSASAQKNDTAATTSPAQTFMEAASGMPLLAPMSISIPSITVRAQNVTSSSYGCTLVRQSPADWVKMKSRQDFDMYWTVQNTGNAVWHANSTKFAYVGGTKMQTHGDAFRLNDDVGRGKKIKLGVDMVAPKAMGTYSTLWSLYSGNTSFCRVTLIVTVTR